MTLLEQYDRLLDERAEQERKNAAQAKAREDERALAIHYMQASMLSDMLKKLGKVQHEEKNELLSAQAAACRAEAERQRALEDFDAEDRALIKAQTIAWAAQQLQALEEAEAHE